jgi:hypothetical protein
MLIRYQDHEFVFSEQPLNIESIGVLREDDNTLVWWLVSEEFSETWHATGPVKSLRENAQGSIELQEHLSASAGRSGGRVLSRLTYGHVPRGFRQVKPEHGRPPKLERGGRYVLHIGGNDLQSFEFEG